MTILTAELKSYKSAVVTNDTSNGGIMSTVEVANDELQNVFPHVFKAERIAGSTLYRKLFDKVHNASDDVLYSASYFFDGPTLGDDYAIFFPGTQRDTQAEVIETTYFGSGYLTADVTAGGSTASFDVKSVDIVGMLGVGSVIRVSDMLTIEDTGNEETQTVLSIDSVVGSVITFTIQGTWANSYLVSSATKISTIYEFGDVSSSVDNYVKSSASGTIDDTDNPITPNHIGTTEDTWTITFSDATNFTVVGLYAGNVGSGVKGTLFEPTHTAMSAPYLSIPADFFGGTWLLNDTVEFQTHPAAVPLWEKRVVPENCAPMSNNKIVKVTTGETA